MSTFLFGLVDFPPPFQMVFLFQLSSFLAELSPLVLSILFNVVLESKNIDML
jgi:hypothetical protein